MNQGIQVLASFAHSDLFGKAQKYADLLLPETSMERWNIGGPARAGELMLSESS